MANKLQLISELAVQISDRITYSVDDWKSYLDTAARLYKYSFDDQLLIYAQRPDATACAEMELWNNKMHRWIKPGSKGIALIRENANGRSCLSYVFDVADTKPVDGAKMPYLWEMHEEHHEAILSALELQYGQIQGEDFGNLLMELVVRAVNESYQEYLHDLSYDLENSFLEGMDELNVEVRFRDILTSSVQYTLLTRCGLEPSLYLEDDDLHGIIEFSTYDVLHHLGDAISTMSRSMLMEIGRAIRTYEENVQSQNLGKPLAITSDIGYTKDAEEFNTLTRKSEEKQGGSQDDKINIHKEGGLSDTRFGTERGDQYGGNAAGQIRDVASNIPQGISPRDIHINAVNRQVGITSERDRPTGTRIYGQHTEGTDETERRGRSTKGQGSNGLGTGGEQSESDGGGTGTGRDRLQVNEKAQETAGEEPAVFVSPTDDLVAAARTLNQKRPSKTKETSNGQLTFDFASQITVESEQVEQKTDIMDSVLLEETENEWAIKDIYNKWFPVVVNSILSNKNYQNACRNSDEQNVKIELKAVLKQIALDIMPEDSEFYNLYTSMPSFTLRLTQEVFAKTYPMLSALSEPEWSKRHNYHITDDSLGTGGAKIKYAMNVAAIRTLKQIETENRLATPEEQGILSKYVGWGGVVDAFDITKENWAREYIELKELLTPEEYQSAQSSVLNAHYTSPTIIKAIYQAVKNMELNPINILEPAMGVGNFFGLVPKEMEKAHLYGVELDNLTGRIARQLYQKADITIAGFETTNRRDFYDLAVGNVPFGEYKVVDPTYDKLRFSIHDYFLVKSLDQLRPGGIMAMVTSHYTMDKKGTEVRKHLARKADLLGALRLPNNAFRANAGTSVVSDILFFQKLDCAPEREPDWVQTGKNADGLSMNQYFLQHPDMVLGKVTTKSTPYGYDELTVAPISDVDLSTQLAKAIVNLDKPNRELLEIEVVSEKEISKWRSLPADPNVKNFSYTLVDGNLYFRENSRMNLVELGKTPTERVRGMLKIRDSARRLIDLQLEGASNSEITQEQTWLNTVYDQFTKKYGLLNSLGNKQAFEQDSAYPLLCSLEVLNDDGKLERKADIFTKRTIQRPHIITSVNTSVEALVVSIGEKACVDLGYMASLMGGSEKIPQIVEDLKGIIFKDPTTGCFDLEAQDGIYWAQGWQTADEYLSGNVREKLAIARAAAETYSEFTVNVEKLEAVQPKDLSATEISVRIGASWIAPEYYKQFLFELLHTPQHLRESKIDVLYFPITGDWNVKGKKEDSWDNVRANATFGTKRINAYQIFENSLNQRDVRIFDAVHDSEGEHRVFNGKETAIAQQKQEAIGEAFKEWIFQDLERREVLTKKYNELFNATRPREYDGSHIRFSGMNPEIHLRQHQKNAVARVLYGHNTLLAHCVGAGKTYEMIAAAMESKRLGLCQKSLFVVPNHLTEQWGGDFLRLYPGANVLVATKKDFEPARRKKFCARIATGDYDAVIIGHTQFEKIPISQERQEAILQNQIMEIIEVIREAKKNNGERYSIKQMEKTKKSLETKLKKLVAVEKKDNVVTFEELGIDRLFVDEAHGFKNLFLHTKMRNVAGISQTEAQKSTDMFSKCRYMDELTGGRGITFATGTPVSNSMVELYTMMRYLQYDTLKKNGHSHFDNWAADFGEKVTAIELSPEGTGFRSKTRFARFFNLPELMNIWKDSADIKTANVLNLDVPEVEYITVTTEPSKHQQVMVAELADRADAVRKGDVEPNVDNMLKITSDGRKLALDQRLQNPLLPDDPDSKVNACVKNIFETWKESTSVKGTQLVFCDLSTPHYDGKFNVYDDIKNKLIECGIPAEEIAYIHDANTEAQKAELFSKVRKGKIRVLIGSTPKMGAGTNVQDRIVASHDLDCPWVRLEVA